MPLLQQVLPAVFVTAVIAAGICALALRWKKRGARISLAACALGFSYACGHLMITGWQGFPPADTTNWLPYVALAATLLGLMDEGLTPPAWMRLLVFALFAAGALCLLLRPKLQSDWAFGQGLLWVACLAAAMVLLAAVCDALLRRCRTPGAAPVFLLIPCGGAFVALMLSGSLLLGQLAAVLAGAILGSLVLSLKPSSLGRGMVPVFVTLLAGLLASGYFFAELPGASALLLVVAPALALVQAEKLPAPWAVLLRAGLIAVPVAAALVIAFRASPPLGY